MNTAEIPAVSTTLPTIAMAREPLIANSTDPAAPAVMDMPMTSPGLNLSQSMPTGTWRIAYV